MPVFNPITPTGAEPGSFSFAGRYGPEIFEDENRNLLKSRLVTVRIPGEGTLATLYSDRTKAAAAPNPFATDARGNGYFFADPGEYDLDFSGWILPVTVMMDPEEAQQGGPPSGPAGGDLAGNYPNPTLAADIAGDLGGKISASVLDANSILKADINDTPVPLSVPASRIVARLAAGGIIAATPEEIKTLLAIAVSDVASAVSTTGHTANSVVAAVSTNLTDLAMGPSTILARLATGNILAATPAQLKTLLAIVAADIADFNTAVRTNRLDQLAVPTAAVALGGQKITGLGTPTVATDAATMGYVDSAVAANVVPALLTKVNGWVDVAGYEPIHYWKENGIVHVKGAAQNGTRGQNVGTLPAGFRPTRGQHRCVDIGSTAAANFGGINIATTGTIIPAADGGIAGYTVIDTSFATV